MPSYQTVTIRSMMSPAGGGKTPPSPKPQRIASVTETRIFFKDQEGKTFNYDLQAELYLNNPLMAEKLRDGIAQVSSPSNKHKITRYHETDAELYTSEGYPITEEDNIQREPLPTTQENPKENTTPDVDDSPVKYSLDDVD